MKTAIALVDLDDSLFQTLRKCPQDLPFEALTAMAHDRAGAPVSFATPRQLAWIEWLSSSTILVPVTGRSVDALLRVNLGFDLAVAAHGGVVLRSGEVCPIWQERMSTAACEQRSELEHIAARLIQVTNDRNLPITTRIIGEGDSGFYVVAKHHDPDGEAELHDVARSIAKEIATDWTRHINGNNVAFLPPFLGKHHAVADLLSELRAAYPHLPVLGLGDSLTDVPFLKLCDMIVMPSSSQLAQHALAGLTCP